MNAENLLPIGSVVTLEGIDMVKLMIIGYYPENGKTGEIYDYLGVAYPHGLQLKAQTIGFNKALISEVLYKGLESTESTAVGKALPVLVEIAVAAKNNGQ